MIDISDRMVREVTRVVEEARERLKAFFVPREDQASICTRTNALGPVTSFQVLTIHPVRR